MQNASTTVLSTVCLHPPHHQTRLHMQLYCAWHIRRVCGTQPMCSINSVCTRMSNKNQGYPTCIKALFEQETKGFFKHLLTGAWFDLFFRQQYTKIHKDRKAFSPDWFIVIFQALEVIQWWVWSLVQHVRQLDSVKTTHPKNWELDY